MKTLHHLIAAGALCAAVSLHAQTILNEGDVDIGIAYEDDAWDLHVHNHSADVEYDPADAVLQILPAAETTVPNDPAYSFLGAAGSTIWQLPQAEQPGLLALGIGSEEIEDGTFLGNSFTLTLEGVNGSGDFFLYSVDGFGAVTPYFNSRDGITAADSITLATGGHEHFFWAFSEPGDYQISLAAAAQLPDATSIASEATAYNFRVETSAVPEPGSVGLLVSAVCGLLATRRLRRRAARS